MIEASNLSRIPEIRHGFFNRVGGFSKGIYATMNCGLGSDDDKTLVARNREIVTTSLGLVPEELVTAYQVHSADVVEVEKPWTWDDAPKADGLVTSRPHIALGVTTADCVPVLFADWRNLIIGAAHAGWRGAVAGIIDAVIDKMVALGANPATTNAAIGPSISQEAYEVGSDVHKAVMDSGLAGQRFFSPSKREGHYMFDLPGYVEAWLSKRNLGSVERIACCTYHEEATFYSYRRAVHRGEPDYGRQIAAITLGPEAFIKS